jgi:hypothetical protein
VLLLGQLSEFVVPNFEINPNPPSTDESINLSSDFANVSSYEIKTVSDLKESLNLFFCTPPPTT